MLFLSYKRRGSGSTHKKTCFAVSLLDTIIVCTGIFFLAPQMSNNQWTIEQLLLNPMELLLLSAIFTLLLLNGIALSHKLSPAQIQLELLAVVVGILMYCYLLLQICLYSLVGDLSLLWPPNLHGLLSLLLLCLPLLGFLMHGYSLLSPLKQYSLSSIQQLVPLPPTTTEITSTTENQIQGNVQIHNTWIVRKQHLLAMLAGVFINILMNNFSLVWAVPMSNGNTVVMDPAIFVPLVFGVIYGPWVGMISGGSGYLLASIVLSHLHISPVYLGNWWGPDVASFSNPGNTHFLFLTPVFALMGFIAGLPFLKASHRERNCYTLCILTLKGILATLGGLLLMNILLMVLPPFSGLPLFGDLSVIMQIVEQYTLPTLAFVTFILPILLTLSGTSSPTHPIRLNG